MPLPLAIPPILAGLGTLLTWLVTTQGGRWVATTMLSLGVGLGTHFAIVQPAIDYAVAQSNSLPSDIAQWLGVLNIDKYLTIIFSAYAGSALKRVAFQRLTPAIGGGTGF